MTRTWRWLTYFVAAAALLASTVAEAQDGFLGGLFRGSSAQEQRRSSQRQESTPRYRLFGGPKRVEIDLTQQMLYAYEGNRVVMRSRISSGRGGITPTGNFTAGPYKAEEHYSSLYNNAHMPWSVQVKGNIFIHGFIDVPDRPASRGCIRLPITGNNPAKRFYHWVEVGTPIRIFY